MAVYKEEKTNTWRAVYRYTDWNGERKQTQKRGFKTKREAQAWEREQLNKTSADLDMTFKSFVDLYTADMKTRLKENTWATKDHIIRTKLLPYFGRLKMCNITAQQIITWQNEMLNHTLEVVGRDQPDQRLYLSKDQESLVWGLDHAENELWKQPPDPVLEAVAKLVSSENREWEGSPTDLAQAIQTDMAVNRLTKHLNVNASRLLEEHQVRYENKTKHAGRRIRLTYMVVETSAFEVIE